MLFRPRRREVHVEQLRRPGAPRPLELRHNDGLLPRCFCPRGAIARAGGFALAPPLRLIFFPLCQLRIVLLEFEFVEGDEARLLHRVFAALKARRRRLGIIAEGLQMTVKGQSTVYG